MHVALAEVEARAAGELAELAAHCDDALCDLGRTVARERAALEAVARAAAVQVCSAWGGFAY